MSDGILFVSYLTGYALIGTAVAAINERTSFLGRSNGEDSFFLAVFWAPLLAFMAVVTPFMAVHHLITNAKLPSLPKRKTAGQKVLNYSEAPVKVLSQIIAQRIMAQPEGVLLTRPHGDYQWVWTSKDGKIKVRTDRLYRNGDGYVVEGATVNDVETPVDKDLLLKALKEARAYNEMKKQADAEAERQRKALDAVESLLLTPEPAEHPMGTHKV